MFLAIQCSLSWGRKYTRHPYGRFLHAAWCSFFDSLNELATIDVSDFNGYVSFQVINIVGRAMGIVGDLQTDTMIF